MVTALIVLVFVDKEHSNLTWCENASCPSLIQMANWSFSLLSQSGVTSSLADYLFCLSIYQKWIRDILTPLKYLSLTYILVPETEDIEIFRFSIRRGNSSFSFFICSWFSMVPIESSALDGFAIWEQ